MVQWLFIWFSGQKTITKSRLALSEPVVIPVSVVLSERVVLAALMLAMACYGMAWR